MKRGRISNTEMRNLQVYRHLRSCVDPGGKALKPCLPHRRSELRQIGAAPNSCAPVPAALEMVRMGQQLRRRAKRKRRKAYLERKRAKQKSMQREPTRAKPKKYAASPSPVATG